MTLLFLLAVLLAIPTFGLSILAWIVWFFLVAQNNAKDKITGLDHMRATRSVIKPLVGGTTADLYQALNVPNALIDTGSEARDAQCGQHILNFISHNPDLVQAFMEALKLQQVKGSVSLPTAIDTIELERSWDDGGPMHFLCYFSIGTLTAQNSLPCFDNVDTASMTRKMLLISKNHPGMMNYVS
jgi:hypothetical protein